MSLPPGETYFRKIEEAAKFLADKFKVRPKVALVFGSGLGNLADIIENKSLVSVAEIPHFPVPKTEGHVGNVISGKIGSVDVIAFQGRAHIHEGHSASDAAFGVLVAHHLGAETFIMTNAAGSLNPAFRPGHFMVLSNHISLFCPDPCIGLDYPELGPRFYDQTDPYDMNLLEKVIQIGRDVGATMQRGNYVFVTGPRYESRADIQLLHNLGADAVGMSTVPEVLALKRKGLEKIVAISSITNMGAGISTSKITHEEVEAQQAQVLPKLQALLTKFVATL